MNAARATTPAANAVRAILSVQPASPARIRPYVTAPAATVNVIVPGRSKRPPHGAFDSVTPRTVNQTAIRQTGRLTRNTQRQPKCSVSSPPASGPAAAAAPLTAPQMPNATPRS